MGCKGLIGKKTPPNLLKVCMIVEKIVKGTDLMLRNELLRVES